MSYVFVSLNQCLHFIKVLVLRRLEEKVASSHLVCTVQCRFLGILVGVSYLKWSVWAAGVHAEVGRPMGVLLNLCGGTPHDTVSGDSKGVTEWKRYVDTQALTSAGQAQLQYLVDVEKGFPQSEWDLLGHH